MRTPFVLLARDKSADGHKRPVAKDWPSQTPTLAQVKAHIAAGGGVGLNLAKSTSVSVLDIDERTPDADRIADQLGQAGALVCRTLRGYHIYIKRPQTAPPPGRYRLVVGAHVVACEWHPGGPDDVRQVVLPVSGTPRVSLGGGVDWLNGEEWTGGGIELEALMQAFSKLPDLTGKFELKPLQTQPQGQAPAQAQGQRAQAEGVIERLAGKGATLEAVLEAVRRNPPAAGERHNYFVPLAAAVWTRWGYRGVRRLEELMFEVWGSEADEREIFSIIQSAMLKYESKSRSSEKRDPVEEIVDQLRGAGAQWLERDGQEYVVLDGWAVGVERLWDWLVGKGHKLSKISAEAVAARLRETLQRADDDTVIVSASPRKRGKAVYVLRESGEVIAATPEGLQFYDTPPAGVVRLWGAKVGRTGDAIADLEEVARAFELLTQRDGKKMLAILAPLLTGIAHGVVVIEGDSGAGKTTLSKFLQAIANSPSHVTLQMGRDARDWVAAARSRLVLGVDESGLRDDFVDFVKSTVSGSTTSVRKLYTTADNISFKLQNSFVFSAVSVDNMPADLARRAIVLNLVRPRGRRDMTEEEFLELLSKEANSYFYLMFYLLSDVLALLGYDDNRTLLQALEGERAHTEAPAWAREDTKADWAQAAWAFGQVLGVDVSDLWKELRDAAAERGLRLWGEVLAKAEEDADFAARLRQGLTAKEIAAELEIPAEEQRSFESRLGRQAPAVRTALSTKGWTLEISYAYNSSRSKRRAYKLYKSDAPTPPAGPGQPGGPGSTPPPGEPAGRLR